MKVLIRNLLENAIIGGFKIAEKMTELYENS